MEKLEHPLLIVALVNALLGPLVKAVLEPLGVHFDPSHDVIPNYLVMTMLIVAGTTVLSLVVRSRLSVENPGKLQILLEDGVQAVIGLLDEWIGPKGHRFLDRKSTRLHSSHRVISDAGFCLVKRKEDAVALVAS